MKKKTLSVLFALLLCWTSLISVSAADTVSIQPRWTGLSSISCSLDHYNGLFSNAKVSSTAMCKDTNHKVTVTVTIQKWNGSSYENTDKSWVAGPGTAATVDKTFSLGTGNYIAHAVAVVTDSAGRYVETVTADSKAIIKS